MAFAQLQYFSRSLGKGMAANVILPERRELALHGPFPVLYLLHGLSDDHTAWTRRSSIERYVERYPLIVVMPDGGRSFYTDSADGVKYEASIMDDLIGYVESVFQTRPGREGRALAGLSMGGYGATKLALKHPDKFVGAVSHSGALGWAHSPMPDTVPSELRDEWTRLVGTEYVGGPSDLYALAEKVPAAQRPALRIDCGVDDFLIEDNRRFHAHLDQIGYAHKYREYPGDHNWEYWDTHIQDALAFLTPLLEIDRV